MADTFWPALGARFKRPKKERRWPSPLAMAHELEGLSMPRHQRYIDERLVAMADGDVDKLCVSLPPQHGKSTITTLWLVLWLLDSDPELRIVVISYNETYASSWGLEAKRIIAKHADNLGWSVSSDSKANSLWRVAGHRGGCMYIGVGGGLSGWDINWVINDDWVKNHEDGFNAEIHAKNWTFHQAVVEQRIQHGVKEIVNMTRWSEVDLVGKVLAHAPSEWEAISLPAMAEDGDILGREEGEGLWLEKNPQEWYDNKRAGLSAFIWAGLYQQRPAPEGGGLLKRQHFRYFTVLDADQTSDDTARWNVGGSYVVPSECVRFGTADTATSTKTSADWTVVGAWAVTPTGDLLLLDVLRARIEEDGLPDALAGFMGRHDLPWLGVESTFATSNLAYQLGRMGLRFVALKADVDKLQRALPLRTRLEQHRLYFPAGATWLDVLESEFMSFTGKATGAHDDTVDMCAYASRYLDTSAAAMTGPASRVKRRRRTGSDWKAVGV